MGQERTILASTNFYSHVDEELVKELKCAAPSPDVLPSILADRTATEVRCAVQYLLSENPRSVGIPRAVAEVSEHRSVVLLVARRILRNPGWYIQEDVTWARQEMRK